MQWTIKRDRIDVAAIARFLREVDDNVQVVMTNEEQKEAGTEALPSLFFLLLLLSRSLSLSLSFFFHKKNHFINIRVWMCISAHSYVQWKIFANHNCFFFYQHARMCSFVLFLLDDERRRRRRRSEWLDEIDIYIKIINNKVLCETILRFFFLFNIYLINCLLIENLIWSHSNRIDRSSIEFSARYRKWLSRFFLLLLP